MKAPEAKADTDAEVAKLTGSVAPGSKKQAKPKTGAAPAGLDGDDDEDLDLAPPEGENEKSGDNVKKKLTALRAEVGNALEGADAKAKKADKDVEKDKKKKKRSRSRSRKKTKRKELASESSQDKYARPKWFGKTTVVSSSTTSSDDDQTAEAEKDKKKKDRKEKDSSKSSGKRRKKKKKRKEKGADRGPFSAGPVQRYDGKQKDSLSDEDVEGEGQVFQAGVSQKSRQLQLIEYAEKFPGRLTARLLGKMKQVLAREETPLNQQHGQNLTPPVASAYFLTVIQNQYKDRLNLRTSRELRSLTKSLDLIVQNAPERAADVLSQRIKSIEVSLADQGWGRAQHVELIPAEGAVLLDKDELAMATKEQNDEFKMRNHQGLLGWRPPQQKGDPQEKGKSKGKGKNKKGKNSGGNWNTATEPEKPPPSWS